MPTTRSFSQKILQPFAGLVHILESERARALTMDGATWDIHFLRGAKNGDEFQSTLDLSHSYMRVASFDFSDIQKIAEADCIQHNDMDERIVEMAELIVGAELPFPANDHYEYWLLDEIDESPLALIFSCCQSSQMADFPSRPEWSALPAAVMPIDKTTEEQQRAESPVNYRLERLVADRAGNHPKAAWFQRQVGGQVQFPPLLVREDWDNESDAQVCQRYIQRQSPRLLMLQGLDTADRLRMEQAARKHAQEVGRFYPLYSDIADPKLMSAIRVEARLRSSAEATGH